MTKILRELPGINKIIETKINTQKDSKSFSWNIIFILQIFSEIFQSDWYEKSNMILFIKRNWFYYYYNLVD